MLYRHMLRVTALYCIASLACAQPVADPLTEAIALAHLHKYREAAMAIERAALPESASQRIVYHRAKAAISLGNGDAPASAMEMEAAHFLAPADPGLAIVTAMAEFQAGEYYEAKQQSVEAAHAYQAAVALAPEVEQYHLALGLELLRHHSFEAAIAVFESAVHRFPHSERATVALGISYYLDGRSAQAVQTLLAADSHSQLAAGYLGRIELERADAPDRTAAERVCGFADARLQALCGGLLLKLDDIGRALGYLTRAAKLSPDDPVARCELGKGLDLAHEWEQARTQMERCVLLDPDSPSAHYRLARIYHRLGLLEESKKQERMRAAAQEKLGAENERRYAAVAGFLLK